MALLQAARSLAISTLKQGRIIIAHSTLRSAARYPCREQIAKGMPWVPSHAASFSSWDAESKSEEEKFTFNADKTFREEALLREVSRIEANKVHSAGKINFKIADDSDNNFSGSDHTIKLYRYYGDETILIEFSVLRRVNGRDFTRLDVTFVDGPYIIKFICSGYADEFSIDSVDCLLCSSYVLNSADVCDLHPSLKKRLMDILELRGIKSSLLMFLCEQIKRWHTKITNKGRNKEEILTFCEDGC